MNKPQAPLGISGTHIREFQGWTIRERKPNGPGPHPLAVLVHGWTGDENSMWVFAKRLPPDCWLVAPRAPYPSVLSGFSWRKDSNATGRWSKFDDLQPAAAALVSILTKSNFPGAQINQFDLIGFSQGGALAYTVALLYPERVFRLGALSAFMPEGAEVIALREPMRSKPAFVAHGIFDELVPLAMAHHAVEVLEQAGAVITYCENEVGHKLGAGCFSTFEGFFNSYQGLSDDDFVQNR